MKKQTLKKLIESLKLTYVNENITAENFPDDGQRGEVEIIDFKRVITSEEAIKEMNDKGYRPATVYELLNWAKNNWGSEEWVVALGQSCQRVVNRYIPYLWSDTSERGLYLCWFGSRWYDNYRFAAVKLDRSVEKVYTESNDKFKCPHCKKEIRISE